MTTWYVDYEGGTNANASAGNGDSFATRRKTIDNCVAAAIAPGDTVRIMGSPPPSSMGQNATWTDGQLLTTRAIASSTNASPIVLALTGPNYTALAPAVGDTLIVNGHATNTNANGVWNVSAINGSSAVTITNADGSNSVGNGTGGATGSIRKMSHAVVALTTAVTANIACCGNRGAKGNWTGADANNVPTVITTDYKEGGECQQISINASMTTGKSAYYATGTLDLSGYQQVSFWIKQTVGTLIATGAVSLRLCTDTVGASSVHTCAVPALGALNQWHPIVVNLGTNLNSAIQSVALYVDTDNGSQAFLIDNIIACKAASSADSLNLTSLISKDPGDHSYGDGYDCWFGIQSINGTRIMLDGPMATIPAASPQRGYSGTTETVTLYKRETTKTNPVASATTAVFSPQDSGSTDNPIVFSGGWDRTNMSTQDSETWFDGQNGLGDCISNTSRPWLTFDRINGARYNRVLYDGGFANATDNSVGRLETCNTTSFPVSWAAGPRFSATTLSAVCCGGQITTSAGSVVQTIGRADSSTGSGVTLGVSSWTGQIMQANNSTSYGVVAGTAGYIGSIAKANMNTAGGYSAATRSVCGSLTANNNLNYGINIAATMGVSILSGSTTGNLAGITISSGQANLRNFIINEASEVTGFTAYNNSRIYSEKHDGIAGNNVIYCEGGIISTDAAQVHGTAAYSWKFSPTSTNRAAYYPLNQSIVQVAVGASALVTVGIWMRRDNTGLTMRLVCKGGQLAGIPTDVVSSMAAAADTWEQVTITFTPTEAGVVDIEAQAYGGTTYNGWVSEIQSITQE